MEVLKHEFFTRQLHSVGELGAKSYVAREKLNAAAFSAFLMDPEINNPVCTGFVRVIHCLFTSSKTRNTTWAGTWRDYQR